MTLAYFNGVYQPLEEIRVPILDRGFLFGDSLYEVVAIYQKNPAQADAHFTRLAAGCAAIGLVCPLTFDDFSTIITTLAQQQPNENCSVYLQITRGVDTIRQHRVTTGLSPTIFAMVQPFTPPAIEKLMLGASAVTVSDIRWKRCDIKTTSLLANILCMQQAFNTDPHATDAILLDGNCAIEGATSNLFIVKQGTVFTPPLNASILSGTTRTTILALAKQLAIPYMETPITIGQLHAADEVWLASTTREIVPIVILDGHMINDGIPGPVWKRMLNAYKQWTATC